MRSKKQFGLFIKLIQHFISSGQLDIKTEQIPEPTELDEWMTAGLNLPRPILAVVQAYTKMNIYDQLMNSSILEDPYFTPFYEDYFPKTIRQKLGDRMPEHRLRRNIIGTILTNKIVNQAGILFFFQCEQLTGKPIDEIAKAYHLLDSALGFNQIRKAILSESASQVEKYSALIELEAELAELTQLALQLPNCTIDFSWANELTQLAKAIQDHIPISKAEFAKCKHKGFSETTNRALVTIGHMAMAIELVYLHVKDGIVTENHLYQIIAQINAEFGFAWLQEAIASIDPKTAWELSHKGILAQSVIIQKLALIRYAATVVDGKKIKPEAVMDQLEREFKDQIQSYFQTLKELKSSRT
ncbi:hypothetical protein EBR96_10860, partial [bacterium]|nr:hypothetical protein [bacterium]